MLQRKEKIAVTIFGLALLSVGFTAGWFTHYYDTLPVPNFQTAAAALVIPDGYTVPISNEKGAWVVNVRIKGEYDLRFLLDTGASMTMIHPKIAEVVGIKAGTVLEMELAGGAIVSMPLARLTQLQVGQVIYRNVKIVLGNPPMQLDGIVGNDLLSLFKITIDPVKKVLIFNKPQGGA